jgi:outer membrane receptor protein involved in Fe transport
VDQAKRLFKQSLVASAALAAAWSSTPANAQGAAPAAAPASAPAESGKAARPDNGGLQVVEVTAQKRKENARDVSTSISVVGSEQLEDRHVTSLVDVAGSLPGVQIDSGGTPGQTSISMRGISSLDVGSVVGTYIDDTPLGSSSSFAVASRFQLDLMPYDIDRIEVLRGPQGTLYGASAMGGLIKYVLKDPDLYDLSGAVGGGISRISGSSGTGWDDRAQVNVPLVKGKLAFSVSASENKTPGYIDNVVSGRDDINDVTQKSSRFALRWTPTNDLSVKLTALHQATDADDLGTILLDASRRPIYGGQKTGSALAQPFYTHVDFYSGTVNWHTHGVDVTSATSFSRTHTGSAVDDSSVYGPLYPAFGFPEGKSGAYLALDLKKVTEELRVASQPGGQLEWLAGTFFTHESSGNQQLLTATANDGTPLPVLDPLLAVDEPSAYREGALFGDLTYKLSDQFDLTGGLRYARNWQANSFFITGVGASLQGLSDSQSHSAEAVTTWMFSPRYRIGENNMVYLRAAKGYRPGSPNLALPGVPPIVHSDTLINYEAGWKALLLDKTLSIDTAIYHIDWKNIQLNNTTPAGVAYLANGGTAQSDGLELSLSWSPVHSLRLGLGTAWTDARLTQDAPTLGGKAGDATPGVPRWNASTSADYYFSLPGAWTGHAGADYRFTGRRNSGFESSVYNWSEGGFGVVGLNVDVSKDIWTLRAYAKNLTNQHPQQHIGYLVNAATGDVANLQSTVLQPRTIGLELDAQF